MPMKKVKCPKMKKPNCKGLELSKKQKTILTELVLRIGLLAAYLQLIIISIYSGIFFVCIFFEGNRRPLLYVHEFGDCNSERLYIYLVQIFFVPYLGLCILYIIGFVKRDYFFLTPFLAVNGVFCVFKIFGLITSELANAVEALHALSEIMIFFLNVATFLIIKKKWAVRTDRVLTQDDV